jgi:hypothetical protein
VVATQLDPIGMKPGLQAIPQVVPLHVAVPLAGTAHAVHELPQVATLLFDTHAPLHKCWPDAQIGTHALPIGMKPGLQAIPQVVPLHVAVPLAGTAHAVHEPPQVATSLFDTHAPLHTCCPAGHVRTQVDPIGAKPALQVMPQVVPLHVATPFAGTGHGVHELPQVATALFDTHVPLHTCCPAGH